MSNAITDAERTLIRGLHEQGLGCNAIARQLGRSRSTISKLAAEMGLTFDRARTVEATAAKQADAAALRAQEMLGALQDAKRLRGQLFTPCKAFNFGGKDNSYNEVELAEPTFDQKRQITQAWGVLIDKSVRLDEHDVGQGDDGAASLVSALAAGLRVAYNHLEGSGDQP